MPLTVGSLFSGIGGLDRGLEMAGFVCRWQVELNPFARQVLAKHWPDVRRHDDAKTFPPEPVAEWSVDLIAGGFPCQPVSGIAATSGRRKGVEDPRWLWPEFRYVLSRIRPRWVLIENVLGLLSSGLGDVVRRDVEQLGYDTDPWEVIGACGAGALHIRNRVFLVAYPDGTPLQRRRVLANLAQASRCAEKTPPEWEWSGGSARHRGSRVGGMGSGQEGWLREPGVCRVVDGISSRMDRDRTAGLGNAVVPQVAELIGRRILAALGPDDP